MSGLGEEAAAQASSEIQALDLTPAQAAAHLAGELAQAGQALDGHDLEAALDAYVRALGLALQLGPAAVESALRAVQAGAGGLLRQGDADGLCALGPAVAGAVAQVQAAGVLPPTAVMEAWAAVLTDLGALLGQVGLALALSAERQAGMWGQARGRARLLDEATGGLFSLADWLASAQGTHG